MSKSNTKKGEGRMSRQTGRRDFLKSAALAGAGFWVAGTQSAWAQSKSPNEKLNIAGVGVGGMGHANVNNCAAAGENIVALCDVDAHYAGGTFKEYPKAKVYVDYREMLDKQKDIDAVIVATPDHTHAVVAMAAMKAGKHVYVQKPMTWCVQEARALTEAARKYKVMSQMGNQGHSGDGMRLVCEWIWSGTIGTVKEVHVWTNRAVWPQGEEMNRPKKTPPVPETLDWDRWLGPAPQRAYNPVYLPSIWRAWCDFGTGALGDMGCHLLDAPFWAMKLKYPESVEGCHSTYWKGMFDKAPEPHEMFPRSAIVRYRFPAREDMPPVNLTWYDGGMMPPRPEGIKADVPLGDGDGGSIFVGDKGVLICGCYGRDPKVYPEDKMEKLPKEPQTIERIPDGIGGHEKDWIRACKTGKPASCNFDYAGPLSEMVLMGNLAVRFPNRPLLWDGEKMTVTSEPKANRFVSRVYRQGWSL
jgi:predicted dehydrogenase